MKVIEEKKLNNREDPTSGVFFAVFFVPDRRPSQRNSASNVRNQAFVSESFDDIRPIVERNIRLQLAHLVAFHCSC